MGRHDFFFENNITCTHPPLFWQQNFFDSYKIGDQKLWSSQGLGIEKIRLLYLMVIEFFFAIVAGYYDQIFSITIRFMATKTSLILVTHKHALGKPIMFPT
jgi:hypothetical protein